MHSVVELGSIQIRIYPSNHKLRHFHISTTYGEAKMRMSDLTLMKGRLRREDLDLVRRWARQHRWQIEDGWNQENGQ